jgi:hypothetical protein
MISRSLGQQRAARWWRAVAVSVSLAALLAACSRDQGTVSLVPPYDDGDKLGTVHATWDNTGEERGFAAGTRLKEPEVRFRYRLDVRNRSDDKLFLRLENPEFVDDNGLAVGQAPAKVECTLQTGESKDVLTGELWVPKSAAPSVRSLRVSRFAVALGERPLRRYREWLLRGRPNEAAQIDAEIAIQAAVPACVGR